MKKKFVLVLFFISILTNAQTVWPTLLQMREAFNPASLSPLLWVNPYRDAYVSTTDNNGIRQKGNIIDSATARTGQELTTAGTLGSKPIYNGEGWYFEQAAKLTTGDNSTYNFLHNGSNFDVWCTAFICPPASGNYYRALISTNGVSDAAKGILVRINSVNGNNSCEVRIGNGVSAYISLTGVNSLTPNATNTIRVTKSGNIAKLFVNGIQVASQTITLLPSTADAAGVMTFASNSIASVNVYLKDVMIFNRALTATEVTSMNSRNFATITPTPMNVYLLAGDSNCAGRGLNSAIASDLTGNISRAYIPQYTTSYDYTTYLGKLLLGTNQTIPTEYTTTLHGAEMRFGKAMGAVADTFIIKYGIGSIPLYQSAFGDWNVASSASYFKKFTTAVIPQALNDLVHVYRRTPVFRGFIWTHGANDAVVGGSNLSWTRAGTTLTITEISHGLRTGYKIPVTSSSDSSTLPIGIYNVTKIDNNTFSITGVDTGATFGTISYSAGSTYKANLTAVINGTIDYLTTTLKNQITGGNGYPVNKLRIFIPETKSTLNPFDATSYSQILAGQQSIGSNFLIENASRSANVRGTISQSTEDLSMQDVLHYSTSAYDTLGQREANYFIPFVNE
jgi:Concanavalin A-like lectin/glucanases superfamily